MAKATQKIVNCPRCGKRCIAEQSKKASSRPFKKSLKGLCTECVVSAFFQDQNNERGVGFALQKDFNPEGLRLPHIQEQFARVLSMGGSELPYELIDWDEVIANWHLPFG